MIEFVNKQRFPSDLGTKEIPKCLSLEPVQMPHLCVRADCSYCGFNFFRVVSLASGGGYAPYERFEQGALCDVIRLHEAVIETRTNLDVDLNSICACSYPQKGMKLISILRRNVALSSSPNLGEDYTEGHRTFCEVFVRSIEHRSKPLQPSA